MATSSKMNVDFRSLQDQIKNQFSGLDPNDPSRWPALPRNVLLLIACLLVVVVLWVVWLSSVDEELVTAQAQEQKLRDEYRNKLVQAVNLDALKKQLEQVQQYVSQLEKQLPSRAEMDALLSDINQAGLGRSLQFEIFRPGQVLVKDYYAELPIAVNVTGSYHDIALFASDIANLSRIVTLNNLSLVPVKDRPGFLTLECTAKTFRYLDPEEVALQQKTAAGKGKNNASGA
jgi:type IV pilus assembly protein PilO